MAFGWNGTCTCRLPGSHKKFGNSIVTDGNRLIVGSEEAPNGCISSGVVNIYQIQTDGSLEKEAELVSSARVVGDEFALYSGDFALSGDYLAVGARGASAFLDVYRVTVFSFDGSSWSERYVKEIEDSSDAFEINGEELIARTATNEITRFDINDGSVLQTIPVSCAEFTVSEALRSFDAIDDLLSINIFCGNQPGDSQSTEIFRRNTAGQYVTAARLDSIRDTGFRKYELFEFTEDRKILLGMSGSQLVSVVETAIDTWSFLQPVEIDTPYFSVHEGQLFIEDTIVTTPYRCFVDYLHVYELDTEGKNWVQTQTLNYHGDYVGNVTSMEFDGDRLSVVRSTDNIADTRPMNAAASLFEKDQAHRWSLVFEQDFIGPEPSSQGGRDFTPSSFAGNNLFFSVVENEVRNIRFSQSVCDYISANVNGGWGWNPITRMSCGPCVDWDGDGWGWDGMNSCRIDLQEPTCFDSPPTGDGWGWNGSAACRIEN